MRPTASSRMLRKPGPAISTEAIPSAFRRRAAGTRAGGPPGGARGGGGGPPPPARGGGGAGRGGRHRVFVAIPPARALLGPPAGPGGGPGWGVSPRLDGVRHGRADRGGKIG